MAVGLTQEEYKEKLKIDNPTLDSSGIEYKNSRSRIKVRCKICNHIWEPKAGMLIGAGKTSCPICGKNKRKKGPRISAAEWWERSSKKHNNKYTCDLSKYVDQNTLILIVCPIHGEFQQKPVYHLHGRGCPECGRHSGNSTNTTSKVIARIEKEFPNMYITSKVKYVDQYTGITLGCKHCGNDFTIRTKSLFNGVGCPNCAKKSTVLTKNQFLIKARDTHGNVYDYTNTVIRYSTDNIIIRCPIHGEFTQRQNTHLEGHGCPECGKVKKLITQEDFIKRVTELHPELVLDEKMVYKRGNLPVTVKCKKHGYFEKRADELIRVPSEMRGPNGCPICTSSAAEKIAFKVLTDLKINFQTEYSFPHTRYRYDFYLEDLNILIELNGEQHYKMVPFWGGEEGYKTRKKNDLRKIELADINGKVLLRINFKEFGIIRSKIIKCISDRFPYTKDNKYYKSFLDFCRSNNLPLDATSDRYKKYKTINSLISPT